MGHSYLEGMFEYGLDASGNHVEVNESTNLSDTDYGFAGWSMGMWAAVVAGIDEHAHVRAYSCFNFHSWTSTPTWVDCEFRGTVSWKGLVTNVAGAGTYGRARIWVCLVDMETDQVVESITMHENECSQLASLFCGEIDDDSDDFHMVTRIKTQQCYELRMYGDVEAGGAIGADMVSDYANCMGLCVGSGGIRMESLGINIGVPDIVPVVPHSWGQIKGLYR